MYLFINIDNPQYLGYYMMALGFVSSVIYTTLITLGLLQTKVSSPKLVNFILTCGTIGTVLTFVVTGLYAAEVVMYNIYSGFVTKHRHHSHVTH